MTSRSTSTTTDPAAINPELTRRAGNLAYAVRMENLIATLYRKESRRIFSTLIRLLGSFDLAEEAMHDAFVAAAEQWPEQGVPTNPVAWLVSTGRFKGIDRLRRDQRFVHWPEEKDVAGTLPDDASGLEAQLLMREGIEDDRLRLIFTCCHPGLTESAQIALTLREVCAMPTEAIASAFLMSTPALAQRIVRAKAKIRKAGIPYEVPEPAQRPARLKSVLRVLYLIFNEGQSAHSDELIDEAIRLARLLHSLLADPEVPGLLALLLLHAARRGARLTATGELIPLEEQDRSLWDRTAIDEGCELTRLALSQHGFGLYALQAAIAAVHGEAGRADATDWPQIVGLYDALLRVEPSPVIALNRAVAVAMAEGSEKGLSLVLPLMAELPGYYPATATAADLYRRLGQTDKARVHYREAIGLVRQPPEKRLLMRRLAELDEHQK